MKCGLIVTLIVMSTLLAIVAGCGKLKGEKGDAGASGANGSNGTPGTVITVVKLCPGVTAYPSTFTEVAFCIEGKLFAVYSTNGGFESEIPPGTYSSNGVNSSCTFTVEPGCIVHP